MEDHDEKQRRDHALRTKLAEQYTQLGNLYHFYAERILNDRLHTPLSQTMRDMASERAPIEGEIAAVMIEAGRPEEAIEDEPEDGTATAARIDHILDTAIGNEVMVQ